jgi:hypothetical protein
MSKYKRKKQKVLKELGIENLDILEKTNTNISNALGTIANDRYKDVTKAKSYRVIAVELNKLGCQDVRIQNAIFKCYQKAIMLNPSEKLVYLADLSNLHLSRNQLKLAFNKIKEINKAEIGKLDRLAKLYVEKSVGNIEKLEKAIFTISSLENSGEISKDFAKSLKNHLDVTKDNVYRLTSVDAIITALAKRLEEVEKKLKKFKKNLKEHAKNIQELVDDGDEQGIINKKIKIALEDAGVFDKAKVEKQIDKIQVNDSKLTSDQNTKVSDALKEYANSFYWTLNNDLLAYRMLSTNKIKGHVYRVNTGKVEEPLKVLTSIGKIVASAVPYGEIAKPVVGGIDLASSIIFKVIHLYSDAKNDRMIKSVNYDFFLGGDLSVNSDQFINLGILSAGISIAQSKQDEVRNLVKEHDPKKPIANLFNSISEVKKSFIKEVIDPIMNCFFDVKKVEIPEVTRLAIADSALFLAWLTDNESDKNSPFTKGIQSSEKLGKRIADLFKQDGAIEKMLKNDGFTDTLKNYVDTIKKSAKGFKELAKTAGDEIDEIKLSDFQNMDEEAKNKIKESKIPKKFSKVFYKVAGLNTDVLEDSEEYKDTEDEEAVECGAVTDIIYDNELLNHTELIKQLLNHYDINKIIDLSSNLPTDLVEEVVTTGDMELLHASLMSLEH